MSFNGLLARDVAQENEDPYTSDTTVDVALSNVPVVNGRMYLVRFRTQWSMADGGAAATDQAWNFLLQVNGVTVDRFARIANQTDAVGTDEGISGTVDASVYWTASATQSTDDFTVLADSVSGTPNLTLQATPRATRSLSISDVQA